MQKITLTIRVEADDLAKWKVESNRAGMNLSEWVRRTANEAAAGRRKIEPEEYLGVEKPEAKKPTKKISTRTPPPPTQSVPAPNEMCQHDYGFKKCPFPNCRNNKWRE